MTLEADDSRRQYATNGTTGPWTVPFYFLANSHLEFVYTVGGVDTTLTLDTDYTVTGAGDAAGGSITTTTAYAPGGLLTVIRNVPRTQLTDYVEGGPFPANSTEDALDKLTMVAQQLYEVISRAFVVPVGDTSDVVLPSAATRANTTLGFDSVGAPTVLTPTSGSAADVLTRLADRTDAAKGAGLVGYLWSLAYASGAVGAWMNRTIYLADHGTSASALTEAIDRAYALGGGRVIFDTATAYSFATAPVVKAGVLLDLNRAEVTLAFAAGSDVVGFDIRDRSGIINGSIVVAELGAPTSANKEYHCAVLVGGSGTSLAGYAGWTLRDLKITTNRGGTIGGRGILVQASSNNGIIENIEFPSSAYLGAAVQISWAGPGGSPPASSQHPYNIAVRNIKLGAMTKAGSSFDVAAIDIVGAYAITVDNVAVDAWAGDAVVQVRVGGFGDTVADAAVKPLLFRSIKVSNVVAKECTGYLAVVNGKANDASGTPIYPVPVIFENLTGKGIGASAATAGIRFTTCYYPRVINCEASYFDRGVLIDESTRGITMEGGRFFANNESGIYVGHATIPEDIRIVDVDAYSNGQDGGSHAGIYLDIARNVTIESSVFGADNEATQIYGIRVTSGSTRIKIRDNYARSVKTGGNAYAIGSATDYGILDAFENNGASDAVKASLVYGGVSIITVNTTTDPTTALPVRRCIAANATIPPTAGTWRRGDMIYHGDMAASTSMGEACVTSGTFSAATDNTGDTDGSTGVITGMTDTSDFFAGEFVTCSAGFATTGPFRVLALTSSTMTVDTTSNAVVANITVSTPDPVFKTMPALGA